MVVEGEIDTIHTGMQLSGPALTSRAAYYRHERLR